MGQSNSQFSKNTAQYMEMTLLLQMANIDDRSHRWCRRPSEMSDIMTHNRQSYTKRKAVVYHELTLTIPI